MLIYSPMVRDDCQCGSQGHPERENVILRNV